MEGQKEKRIEWVDISKAIAIIFVLIDHSYSKAHNNYRLAVISFCSVSLFIFLMGVTSYWSYDRSSENLKSILWKKCRNILLPYIVASIVYSLAETHFFDLEVFLNHLVHFNASLPFYYVLLYLQLIFAVPILYALLKNIDRYNHPLLLILLLFAGITLFAIIAIRRSNILDVYGGGGIFLGGTYLILLFLGMTFGKFIRQIEKIGQKLPVLSFVSCFTALILWWSFLWNNGLRLDMHMPFGSGINPPGLSLMVSAVLVAFTVFSFEQLMRRYEWTFVSRGFLKLAWMGKHTLYVFLYHKFFLDFVFPALKSRGVVIQIPLLRCVVYFIFMISGSLLIEFVIKNLKKEVVELWTQAKAK